MTKSRQEENADRRFQRGLAKHIWRQELGIPEPEGSDPAVAREVDTVGRKLERIAEIDRALLQSDPEVKDMLRKESDQPER